MNIDWSMTGGQIEEESFRRIEREIGPHRFSPGQWKVVRRMIHASADFSIANQIHFAHDPVNAGLRALEAGALIYCDSNMIRSGISLPKLRSFNPSYSPGSLLCHVADADVTVQAAKQKIARSLAALEKAKHHLEGAIVLVGNAPLALAGLARMMAEGGPRPRLVIGMPVGFVHVEESKQMIMALEVPQVVLKGRRGGSPLAVAALHGIMENKVSENSQ